MRSTAPPPPVPGDDGDSELVKLLKSDVTSTWGRTARAGLLILFWGFRRWPVAVGAVITAGGGGGLVAWLVR